ncbi:MAG: EAL domain-containing protein [Gammaproteobacteria bacterium]|nr:EAL domain-containing protein [Gammaproteobacteria bacterium]
MATTQHALAILWRLTDVTAQYPDLESRRQARLLATLLSGLIPLIILAIGLEQWAMPAFGPIFTAVSSTTLALIVALLLNRQGYYTTAAVLTLIATATACYAAILIPPHEIHAYAYLSINVLLAALLFGQAGILASCVINVFLLAVVLPPLGLPVPSTFTYAPALFVIVVAGMLSLAVRHRDLQENERRRALADRERLLSISEAQYRRIVETSQEGIWQIDAGHRTTFVNRKMASMLGYTTEEMAQRPLFDFMDAAGAALAMKKLDDRRAGINEQHDFKFSRKNGSVLWTRLSANPLLDANGNYCGSLAMVTDISERKRNDDALQLLTTGTADHTGSEFFSALVQHLAQALDAKYALVTECIDPSTSKLRTLGFYAQGAVQPNFEYLLTGTPCEIVMNRGCECYFPEQLQHLFPNDSDLVMMGAQSYLGEPLNDLSGRPLGHLCVLDTKPMHSMAWASNLMAIFAARAAAELRRQRAEQQTKKLSSAVEQTADAVIITDRLGTIEYVNYAFEQISGYTSADAVGQRPSLVKSGKHDLSYYQRLWKTLQAGEVFRDILVNRRKNGELYYEEKTITPLRDTAGVITHFISTGKDITERMQSQERLRIMAHHDALTELPNRTLFLDRLTQSVAYARWHRRLVAIMFLDLDRFKHINDTLGHDAGDQLLQALAVRLKATLRDRDTVARFGGDEFAILLDDVASEKDVALLANKILEAMRQPYLIGGHKFHLTVSIGISLYPNDGQDNSTLLRNADIAMYRAKDLGKNTYQLYSAEMSHRAFERLALEASLHHALEQNEFVIFYQPQVNMATQELLGMEALLRWRHPELGLMAPADFLELLEESGLIVAVGDWVLRSACEQARAWCDAGLGPIRVAVNLSGHQLRQPNFLSCVTEQVKRCRLPNGCLELEITETVLMQDAERALNTLAAIDRASIRVAIDDFGTGYSSLGYLKRFPIDTLKIDRSFVHDITTDPQDAAIVRSVIAMARNLKLEIVAEGVEHEAQLAFLRNEHCDIIQGYFISPALPAPEATAFLISHRAKS